MNPMPNPKSMKTWKRREPPETLYETKNRPLNINAQTERTKQQNGSIVKKFKERVIWIGYRWLSCYLNIEVTDNFFFAVLLSLSTGKYQRMIFTNWQVKCAVVDSNSGGGHLLHLYIYSYRYKVKTRKALEQYQVMWLHTI